MEHGTVADCTPVANLNPFATSSVNTLFMPEQWTYLDFDQKSFSLPSWQRGIPGLMPSVSASSDIVSATPSCLNKYFTLMVGTLKLSQYCEVLSSATNHGPLSDACVRLQPPPSHQVDHHLPTRLVVLYISCVIVRIRRLVVAASITTFLPASVPASNPCFMLNFATRCTVKGVTLINEIRYHKAAI